MNEGRVHRVVSDDGTEIAGLVRGQGPPLVLVPGAFGEGNPDMDFMQPFPGAALHLLLDEPARARCEQRARRPFA